MIILAVINKAYCRQACNIVTILNDSKYIWLELYLIDPTVLLYIFELCRQHYMDATQRKGP